MTIFVELFPHKMMIKRFLLFSLLFSFCTAFYCQNTNAAIKNASGTLLPATAYFCPGGNLQLSAGISGVASGGYNVSVAGKYLSRGSRNLSFPVTAGNNNFSAVNSFPAGFNFSMYGVSYTKYVVGSNGRLILGNGSDLDTLPGTGDTPPSAQIPSSVYQNLKGSSLPLAQIFFGFSPRNYSQNTDYLKILKNEALTYNGHAVLTISIVGTNPLGTYDRATNAVIYLVSDTNEIFIQYYETTTDNAFISGKIFNNSVLGIQNASATKAKWPSEGRNPDADDPNSPYRFGQWTNTQDVYKFSPANKTITKIEWFSNGTSIGTGATINFQPHDGDLLKVVFTYDDGTTDDTNSVLFKNYTKPVVSQTPGTGCGVGSTLAIANPQSNYTYTWTSDDPSFNATGNSIIATKSGTYYAIPNGCVAQKSDPVAVTIASPIVPPNFTDGATFPYCDNLGQKSAQINLLQLVGYTPDANSTVTFTDPAGNVYSAANGYSASLASGTTAQFEMHVTSTAVNCPINKQFSVNYLSFPTQPLNLTSGKLCFGATTYSVENFKADFPQYAGFDVNFSTDNVNFSASSVNPSTNRNVFARLSKSGFNCSSSVNLTFDFYPAVVADNPQIPAGELQHCADPNQTFDLENLAEKYINSSGNVVFKFYQSLADVQAGTNAVQSPLRAGLGNSTIFVTVQDRATGCLARNIPSFVLTVYKKPQLNSKLATKLTNCAGNTNFSLPINISDYVSLDASVAATIKFFASNGTEITSAQFANYDAAAFGNAPYAQISYNSTCGDMVPFSLNYFPKPTAAVATIPVCGQTSYSLTDFENKVVTSPSSYTFTDENGNPLPDSFDLSPLPNTVKFIIVDKTTGCKSDVQTVQFANGNPTPTIATEVDLTAKCDTDFDGIGVSFNLDDAKALISSDGAAVFEYFSDSRRSLKIDPNFINTVAGGQKIYGKVTSSGFCPVDFIINLKVNTPTNSSTLQDKYYICYGDKLTVDAGSENTDFHWSDGQTGQVATFTAAGSYSVKLTNAVGCSYTQNFIISNEHQPIISQINASEAQIEVIASGGNTPYTYFYNGSPSASNILQNPAADSYEIYVQGADGCRGPSKFVYNIVIKNAITPNGDGINDTWFVKNLEKMDNPEIMISDRYGKTVFHSTDKGALVWDGTSGGRVLPTATYWYAVKWHDPATLKDEVRQGWILLKNDFSK